MGNYREHVYMREVVLKDIVDGEERRVHVIDELVGVVEAAVDGSAILALLVCLDGDGVFVLFGLSCSHGVF